MTERRYATRRETADMLRVTERTVDRLARAGRLKTHRIGRSVRFLVSNVEALVSHQ